jgi:hypothetical protein
MSHRPLRACSQTGDSGAHMWAPRSSSAHTRPHDPGGAEVASRRLPVCNPDSCPQCRQARPARHLTPALRRGLHEHRIVVSCAQAAAAPSGGVDARRSDRGQTPDPAEPRPPPVHNSAPPEVIQRRKGALAKGGRTNCVCLVPEGHDAPCNQEDREFIPGLVGFLDWRWLTGQETQEESAELPPGSRRRSPSDANNFL